MHELHLLCPRHQVDTVSDALMELQALSVSIEDADADTPDEEALYGEPGMPIVESAWQRSIVKALFMESALAEQALTVLMAQAWAQDVRPQAFHSVDEQDWVRLTQSQFPPVEITPRFWIVPSWHEVPPLAQTVIQLDPGQAFGTGTHPTTRMCLRWIAKAAPEWAQHLPRVLDYGCGSGILAIAAAMHGAQTVDACDIDPASVEATLANASANRVQLHRVCLPDDLGPPLHAYDVVLANILATPLKLLSTLLAGHLRPGGHLVLAGILERQAQDLQAAYAQADIHLQIADEQEGWILMTGRQPG